MMAIADELLHRIYVPGVTRWLTIPKLQQSPQQRRRAAKPARHSKVRFVTATSLLTVMTRPSNIMRRILQSLGAEVIHLGHNRSVDEIVTAAIQEDAQGIAVSSIRAGT
ncbi:MAG: hypothetical protein R3C51_12790 [Parvularculaceae bacterium]